MDGILNRFALAFCLMVKKLKAIYDDDDDGVRISGSQSDVSTSM